MTFSRVRAVSEGSEHILVLNLWIGYNITLCLAILCERNRKDPTIDHCAGHIRNQNDENKLATHLLLNFNHFKGAVVHKENHKLGYSHLNWFNGAASIYYPSQKVGSHVGVDTYKADLKAIYFE